MVEFGGRGGLWGSRCWRDGTALGRCIGGREREQEDTDGQDKEEGVKKGSLAGPLSSALRPLQGGCDSFGPYVALGRTPRRAHQLLDG